MHHHDYDDCAPGEHRHGHRSKSDCRGPHDHEGVGPLISRDHPEESLAGRGHHHKDHSHRGHPRLIDDPDHLRSRLGYIAMLTRRADAGRRKNDQMGRFGGRGRVLSLLAMNSPIAQKELAYILGIRSQSLAEQLARLESEGLVERQANPDDRRSSLVLITDAGREAVGDQDEDHKEPEGFTMLSADERAQLAALLDKVIAQLEAEFPGGIEKRMAYFKQRTFAPDTEIEGLEEYLADRSRRGPGEHRGHRERDHHERHRRGDRR